jgi:hypothetical protein
MVNNLNNKVVTFDFDDCLFEDPSYQIGSLWAASGTTSEPIKRVHDLVQQKHEEGYDIHVVTSREEKHVSECWDLIKLYNLPIKSVVATAGKNKTPFLLKLKSVLHVDDNVQVCVLAQQAGIEVLLVDQGQVDINSTAALFDKI